MKKTGQVATSALMIKPSVKIPQVWPAAANVKQTGTVPGARSFDTIAAQQPAGFTRVLNAAAGQGSNPSDATAAVFEGSATITPPPGYTPGGELSGTLFFLPPRWDEAKYLSKPAQGGAAFTYLVPLVYSTKAGAPERAVAQHIKNAFTEPGTTKPVNANKKVPGSTVQTPLTATTTAFTSPSGRSSTHSGAPGAWCALGVLPYAWQGQNWMRYCSAPSAIPSSSTMRATSSRPVQ
ncbi:hypothetical protein ACFWMG_18975 [Streptomyces sp. NPDC127074]|uniref:hypothetical protein n=1 Tax=Streptomyces sp. NPDC127074 TaxID=3347130 RepID=UPI003662A9D3